jgi:hypothetical protein
LGENVKKTLAWLLFVGCAALVAGYEISQALIARSSIDWSPYVLQPVMAPEATEEKGFPIVTVQYSNQHFDDIDHLKFRSSWWAAYSPPINIVIVKHEREGWYLKDTLLTDKNWAGRINEEIRSKQINYILLAIRPTDPFMAAIAAADQCRAMHPVGKVQCIVLFQCEYN